MPVLDRGSIDPDADRVVRRLARHGHKAYLVGGCVRDILLDRRPKDFDVATSATPNEIRRLFRNCRIIGRRFRLAHIFFGGKIMQGYWDTLERMGIDNNPYRGGFLQLVCVAETDAQAEKDEREEFVVEASYLLKDRFLSQEVWENLGLPVKECMTPRSGPRRWAGAAGTGPPSPRTGRCRS